MLTDLTAIPGDHLRIAHLISAFMTAYFNEITNTQLKYQNKKCLAYLRKYYLYVYISQHISFAIESPSSGFVH